MNRRLTSSVLKVVVGLFAVVAFSTMPIGCASKCCGRCKVAKGNCPPGCTKPCCAKKGCPPGCTKPCCKKK